MCVGITGERLLVATKGQPVRNQKIVLLKKPMAAPPGAYAITGPVLPTLPPEAGKVAAYGLTDLLTMPCQRITYGRLPLRASSAGVRFA